MTAHGEILFGRDKKLNHVEKNWETKKKQPSKTAFKQNIYLFIN